MIVCIYALIDNEQCMQIWQALTNASYQVSFVVVGMS